MKITCFLNKTIVVVFCFLPSVSICQTKVADLAVGDQTPASVLIKEIYAHSGSAKLSDLQGNKLLLIDFWATWCAPCVKGLPDLDSLQRKFEGQLSVVAVTDEPREKVSQFFTRHPKFAGMSFPFVVNDSDLSVLFPHQMVPHVVWVDTLGKVRAITSKNEVTEANVRKMLVNNIEPMKEKHDLIDYDFEQPLSANYSEKLYSSLLVRTIPGVGSRGNAEKDDQGLPPMISKLRDKTLVKRVDYYNYRPTTLFILGGFRGKVSAINRSRTILEVRDSSNLLPPTELKHSTYSSYSDWLDKNLYCYELSLSSYLPAAKFYEYMFEDLNRLFPFKANLEKRPSSVYLLTRKSTDEKIPYSSKSMVKIAGAFNVVEGFEAMSMQEIVDFMNFDHVGPPLVNATGIEGLIDLPLHYTFDKEKSELNFDELQKNFEKLGFELTRTTRLIDVLVIRDK